VANKPSYLGLLNAIALAEGRAHTYLTAWAAVTADEEVRAVLNTVAAREGEHSMSFAKRINELGFSVRDKEDPSAKERLAIASSRCSDLEKMERLGFHRLDTGTEPDLFDDVFRDHSIDVATGELLGRYIAEERDTARLLRCCYEKLKERYGDSRPEPARREARMDAIERRLEAICVAVDELRQMVTRPDSRAGNGSRRVRDKSKA
jgi:rubrerythrin